MRESGGVETVCHNNKMPANSPQVSLQPKYIFILSGAYDPLLLSSDDNAAKQILTSNEVSN